jgi:hypothetical protein
MPQFDAYAGRDFLDLPAARAHVFAQHQMWQDGAGIDGERYPAGMRPLLTLGHAGGLAALFQLALAPVLTPGLQASLAAGPAPLQAGREVLRRWNLDERREADWRLLVGMDAQPDQAPERLAPGAAAPGDGADLARIGLLPGLDADISSTAMPVIRLHGEAPRGLRHRELRQALSALLNTP